MSRSDARPRRRPDRSGKHNARPRVDPRPESARSGRRARATGAQASRYARIDSIDGRHPLVHAVPTASVLYPARRRRDSEIAYFNFALAREVGLIPRSHPDELRPALRRALLDAFSLVIVNEWDEAHSRLPSPRDRLPHRYMATRYLQLQHPDKRGLNSGDGRSIWNGLLRSPRGLFDVSSCGTGVTRLCPATSAEGRFFKTGNAAADYGCGTAHIEEGIGAALMSEAFERNGVRTERVLAVLALPNGQAINVRIASNLLRPSHFFGLLRRREHEALRRMVLYYADREIADGRWPALRGEPARIRHLTQRVALDFARASATFESEYIFCWLDWDGDNVLTDGSIIDYGSVRQFGLYHHSYRFEDTDRMSTSIPEQKRKARQIVQRFVQIRELLLHGSYPALDAVKDDEDLQRFDREFETHRRRLFLRQLGLEPRDVEAALREHPSWLDRLLGLHHRLERRRSSRGERRVPDGLTWNAVYCMRDVLRELPGRLLEQAARGARGARGRRLSPEAFYEIALSKYASRKDRAQSPYRRRLALDYQRHYREAIDWLARRRRCRPETALAAIRPAAEARNPYARMTGDGLTYATRRITSHRRRLAPEETFRLVQAFADFQQRAPLGASTRSLDEERPLVRRLYRDLLVLAEEYREGL